MRFSSFIVASAASAVVSATTADNCTVVGTYTVVKGDTLGAIATAKNVTLNAIEYVNPQIANFDSISINETINVPNVGCVVDFCNIVSNYTVVAGDDLNKIAARFNISLAALESVNTQITNFNFIDVGDVIKIPASTCTASSSITATANCVETSASNNTYTVVSGDTFYIIATQKLGITLGAFEDANPQVPDFTSIEIGQVLNVPVCGICVPPSKTNGTYTVAKGDTFYILASEKFNITLASLEAANPQVADFNIIDIGQVLNVPVCSTGTKGSPFFYPNTTLVATGLATPVTPGGGVQILASGTGVVIPKVTGTGVPKATTTTTGASSTATIVISTGAASLTYASGTLAAMGGLFALLF